MICGRPKIEAVSIRDVLQWADRIEAAAERERDEDRQLAAIAESDEAFARCARCDRPERSCNAAAMRSALAKFLDLSRRGLAFFTSYRYTEAENTEIEDAFDEAKAALSAPARNCDRFATELDARLAWKRETKCKGDYRYWLFAPAEGGAE